MNFIGHVKNSRLHCLASLLIGTCGILTVLYCIRLLGHSVDEPIISIDAFIDGDVDKASGDIFDDDTANGNVNTITNLQHWLTELREGLSWKRGSFCDAYFVHTFSKSIDICNRVQCQVTAHASRMGRCIIKGLALQRKSSNKKKRTGIIRDLSDTNSFWLARNTTDANIVPCPGADLSSLDEYMEVNDYARTIVRSTVLGTPKGDCQQVFEGTTFFYVGMETHIYFKFLAWYNLHKSLLENSNTTGIMKYQIVRFPEGWESFPYPEFEQQLFPEVIPLSELQNKVVCFEKVVMSPWAYAATPFRCKMDKTVKSKCSSCTGLGLATDLKSFRERVLGACKLPPSREKNLKKNVLVIKRKPYIRHQEDKIKNFKRIWKNADEFVTLLSKELQAISVTGVYAEELPICKQIELAYRADVLVGLHGAGLVHLWWMQEGSHVVEFMPSYEVGNAAFAVLSKLLGINIHSMSFQASSQQPVSIPMDRAINEIRKLV